MFIYFSFGLKAVKPLLQKPPCPNIIMHCCYWGCKIDSFLENLVVANKLIIGTLCKKQRWWLWECCQKILFSVIVITISPSHLAWKVHINIARNEVGMNSLDICRQNRKFIVRCSHPPHNLKFGHFTAKKCTKL